VFLSPRRLAANKSSSSKGPPQSAETTETLNDFPPSTNASTQPQKSESHAKASIPTAAPSDAACAASPMKAAKASSTPTPSSTLSSEASPTSASSLSLSLEVEELRNKSFLERLQDLWYERSGTSEILALKESVNESSLAFDQASAKVTLSRRHLDDCLRDWERTSGQHLQLLQRRESWTPDDAQSFANLVSKEITTRRALEQARKDLGKAEELLSKRQLEYMNRMRRRYHEEQIWQDQWRVLGTYGTWSLIVLNSCVFLGSQFFLQQREHARMKAIEELVRENRNQYIMGHSATASTAATVKMDTETSSAVHDATVSGNDAYASGETEQNQRNPTIENTQKVAEKSAVVADPKNWREQVISEWQKVQTSAVNKWQQIRNRSEATLVNLKSRTQKVVATIPALKDMPKSPEEVHVPSAIVGASAMGAVVVVAMLLIPSNKR
jgi:She9 / Mdm33 family